MGSVGDAANRSTLHKRDLNAGDEASDKAKVENVLV
jgi:hypothetical protein